LALENGHADIVRILLIAGANIDGHEDYVRFLLDGEV
jgi:ankyrin repeat protein